MAVASSTAALLGAAVTLASTAVGTWSADSWRNNRGDKSGITRDEPGHSETAFCNIVAWDENGKGGRSLPFFVSAKQVTGRYFRIFLPSMRRFISARVAVSTTLA